MRDNVISFPQRVAETPRAVRSTGAKTLFLHIKSTTLIMHSAGLAKTAVAGSRAGKKL